MALARGPTLTLTLTLTVPLTLTLRPLLAYVKSIKGTRDLAQVAWSFRVRVGVWVRVRVRVRVRVS